MDEQTKKASETVTLTINGQSVTVPKGTTVYNACRQLGIDIPIFCYQDRMPPFGACRVCLVEVEKMGKLQTSCTLEATEGMVVKTESAIAAEGREAILELLLINHPLDCPICDRGGECPLQDQALKFGPGESRFYEEKRHFVKPKSLGPVLMLDRERCIACARCTRFGSEIAGDNALEFHERGFKTEVCTPDGQPVKSKFIGNTIKICPVGALTSQVYRFRARPWDNDSSSTTCTLCPVGCSMILDSRDGEIMRTRSEENKEVNDIWLCDKGWFGYEYVGAQDRLTTPLIRRGDSLQPASWEEAISYAARKMAESKGRGKSGGIGGNPLTTEECYLFQQLIRLGTASNNLDHCVGMSHLGSSLDEMSGMSMAIGDCEDLDYAFLFGVDLTEEFPVIWLRLRQAINKGAKVYYIGNFAPEMHALLAKTDVHAPGGEVEAIARHRDMIAMHASKNERGAIFVGDQYLNSLQRDRSLAELKKLKKDFPTLSLNFLSGRGNSTGARLAGMRPNAGPFGSAVSTPGLDAVEMIEAAASEQWDYLHVAGANPAVKCPTDVWEKARRNIRCLVVQDLFLTETAQQADVVLPTLSFAEKLGTFVNIEGRMQPICPGKAIPEGVLSDGEIFERIAQKMGLSLYVEPSFSAALKPGRRYQMRIAPEQERGGESSATSVKPSDGLRAVFIHRLFDDGVRMRHGPHVSKLAERPCVRLHSTEAISRGLREGEVARLASHGRVLDVVIRIDDGVAPNTLLVPLGFKTLPAYELGARLINGMLVELSSKGGRGDG